MSRSSRAARRDSGRDEIWIHSCDPGEWIAGIGEGVRPLHVYRLASEDWLVSEVGRAAQGRGGRLCDALVRLAATTVPMPGWWARVADAIDHDTASGQARPATSAPSEP